MIEEPAVVAVERETARYYDLEEGREAFPLDPRRVAVRDRFVDLVRTSRPSGRVLEIGTGPGRDAVAMVEAGLDLIGCDLSAGHAARAAARGLTMIVGSARSIPLATGSIDGLWSMSTLMHVPDAAIEGAMREIGRVVGPGARAAIGVWGGPDVEEFPDEPRRGPSAPRRLFSRRSEARWRSLLTLVGRVDAYEVWDVGASDDAFRYHLAFLTAHP